MATRTPFFPFSSPADRGGGGFYLVVLDLSRPSALPAVASLDWTRSAQVSTKPDDGDDGDDGDDDDDDDDNDNHYL
ncbi:hypothetical protein Cob_v008514 [Colletotrichum orbiculare MAFF 240422]|uniref:Uncharacterized protein n=1 Tax=Colletotrichum orbiculare (strain 104-T / ATCC 96160 / CBS 514.97 / LARS 414 / MAFF 240422) TaxID=1213857 RepID=N4VIU3_COLOR|nr:hypothetical protein Cob_v008514 [Colletotrichum orbiculare MAFF 240422]